MSKLYEEARKYLALEQFDNAVPLLEKAAAQGDARAQYDLARCYKNGRGVELSYEKAAEWYTKAAEQGYAQAQNNLGLCYESGEGVEKSYEKALVWYEKSAEQDSVDAQFNLGRCYENGRGVEQSYEKAVEWYEKAAKKGRANAQYNLGRFYKNGRGVERSYEKAVEWYTKAAEKGYASAQNSLAVCYENGEGVEQSMGKAVELYKKSAGQGNATAQYNLGRCYYYGEGIEQSYEKAVEWYLKAANKGYASAQNNLGVCYKNGHGVERSDEKAVEWYLKAVEKGCAAAQCGLGNHYYFGKGIEQSYEKAVELFAKAAEQGEVFAICNLGVCYGKGRGVEKSLEKAIELYKIAAEKGSIMSLHNLGELYYRGEGVEQSYETAIEYFMRATDCENPAPEAFYYLGDCYHNGYGVEQDVKKAKDYYEKAIEHGYNCKYALEMVEKDLTLEEFYQEELQKIAIGEPKRERQAREKAKARYEEIQGQAGVRALMAELAKKGYDNPERKDAIEEDLKKEFGETWDLLKPNAKKSLITGFFIYSVFLDMGKDYYDDLDFSPVINQLSKAYETELREFFFKGYLRFLQAKKVDCHEFVKIGEKQQIAIIKTNVDKKTKEETYEYQKEDATSFTLGGFYYLIDSKEAIAFAVDDRIKSRKVMGDDFTSRRVNKHVLEYACELFAEDAFGDGDFEKNVVNYLIDISTDTKTIKDRRNAGAHEKTMDKDEAAITADYLVKIHKRLKNFIERIDPKYAKDGYFPDKTAKK